MSTDQDYRTCEHATLRIETYGRGILHRYAVCDTCGAEGPDKRTSEEAIQGFREWAEEWRQGPVVDGQGELFSD